MELVNHIRDLLYHHDCVVVPGFGGFVTNERSARIDMATNSFYPPARQVGFNARLDHNDGLLISYLSARLSVNYVDARRLVESFVEEVAQKFYEGKGVYFEGIGHFMVDRQKNIQFDPDPAANFLTDTYGLSFFRYPTLENVKPSRLMQKEEHDTKSNVLSRRIRRILRYAAIGIPLVAALSWGAMQTGLVREFRFDLSTLNPFSAVVDNELHSEPGTTDGVVFKDAEIEADPDEMSSQQRALLYEETIPEEEPYTAEPDRIAEQEAVMPDARPETDPAATEMVETDPAATEIAEIAPSATLEIAEPAEQEVQAYVAERTAEPAVENVVQPSRSGTHFLIAGTFRNIRNAVALGEELEKEGYRSEIIDSGTGLYYLSVFSATNYRETLFMLRQVRAFSNMEDIWIFSS